MSKGPITVDKAKLNFAELARLLPSCDIKLLDSAFHSEQWHLYQRVERITKPSYEDGPNVEPNDLNTGNLH